MNNTTSSASSVKNRALQALNLNTYNNINKLDKVGHTGQFKQYLNCPYKKQYILRMIVQITHGQIELPEELEWLRQTIETTQHYQKEVIQVNHSFCYVTVRHGIVESVTDDEWHVDGFSTKITHIPEQNYIISDCYSTEYVEQAFDFPSGFDPLKHNIQHFFGDNVDESGIKTAESNTLYCIDPYIVHRRPMVPENTMRTFVRISYIPIEIIDDANTPNPLIPMRKYNRDGVDIRNQLERYGDNEDNT